MTTFILENACLFLCAIRCSSIPMTPSVLRRENINATNQTKKLRSVVGSHNPDEKKSELLIAQQHCGMLTR
jgi:hypothetical protein